MDHRKRMTKKDQDRDKYLRREYQVTLEERTALSKFQGDKCAICGKFERDMKISLSLDHSHQNGLMRGLLCVRCNKAIEILNCDPKVCLAASEYLTNPPFVVLLGERYTAIGKVGTKIRRKRLAKMREDEKRIKEKEGNNTGSKKQSGI